MLKQSQFDCISIQSLDGSSEITCVPQRGGALSSIIMPGISGPRELLFQHDYFWDNEIDDLPGGLPLAFPVFARLERQGQRGAYLYEGNLYHLPIHGFAWQEAWEAAVTDTHRLVLTLSDNARTRKQYPFSFRIELCYELHRAELICHQTYTNLSDKPMPYSAGFHPYFLTPAFTHGKEAVQLDFAPERCFTYNDQFTDLVGDKPVFALPTAITRPEVNEQLTRVGHDKEIRLTYPDGDRIHLCAEGIEDENLFPFVQLYTIPDKPFFCAEPIMAPPNAMNTVSGMRWLQPGQSERGLLRLWLASGQD